MRVPTGCVALLAALVLAGAAAAAPGIRYGIQDDAWLAHGPGTLDQRLDELERLGVDVVRYNLRWDAVESQQGTPDWSAPHEVLGGLRDRGIPAVIAIVGAPGWANGDAPSNAMPAGEFNRAEVAG